MTDEKHKHLYTTLVRVFRFPQSKDAGWFDCECGERLVRVLSPEEVNA